MKLLRINPLWAWAARDIIRRPLTAILLGAALASLVAVTGVALLLTQALSNTATEMLQGGPSIVIRRIDAGGWTPLPEKESVEIARSVPGVTDAGARVWGTANGPGGPLTVVGMDEKAAGILTAERLARVPKPGEAVVGPGIPVQKGALIRLASHKPMDFEVIDTLDAEMGMAAYDLVLLDVEDARVLLGIAPGFASDLALAVFHEQEEAAVAPDLVAAFPWPVRISTRKETVGIYSAGSARRGGIALITLLPALLALSLIVAGTVREHIGQRHEVGLLKALGWTSADVVRLQMYRALLVGAPGAVLGMVVAYALVFWPGSRWPCYLLLGWKENSPGLFLNASGAVLVLLEIAALTVLPFLLATLWPSLRDSAVDPQDLFESKGG